MASAENNASGGPHQNCTPGNRSEQFLADLFDTLWDRYRQRVSYVRDYERVIADAGASLGYGLKYSD